MIPTPVGGVAERSRMMMRLSFVRVDVSSGTIGKASSTLNVYAALIHTTHSCVYAHNYI